MQSSRYGPGQRSLGASSSGQQKPAKGFWGKLKRLFQSGMLKTTLYYRRFRGVLWMGTTGFIFLIAPFAFSHFLEVSEELHQITRLGASESKNLYQQQWVKCENLYQNVQIFFNSLQQSMHSLYELLKV